MLIKVKTDIIIDVRDMGEGEEACFALDSSLASQIRGFPHGEIVGVKVDEFERVSDQEAKEEGWVEE